MLPNDPLDIALAHAREGRLAEARAGLEAVLATAPDHAEALHMLGVLALQQGQYADAVRSLERSAQLAPRMPQPWANLGVARAAMADFTGALQAHERALRLDPGNPELLRNKAVALRQLGRAEESLACARAAASRLPGDVLTVRVLGEALLDLGRTGEALAAFDHAVSVFPGDPVTRHNRGTAYYRIGVLDAAAREFREAIAIAPDLARAHDHLALVLTDQGELDEALAHAEKAIGLAPSAATFHANLALVLDQRGDSTGSLARCEAALALDPRCGPALSQRAVTLASLGRDAEADEAYAQAVAAGEGDVGMLVHRLHLRRKACEWRGHDWLAAKIAARAAEGAPCPPFALLHVTSTPALQRSCAERFAKTAWPTPRTAPAVVSRERIHLGFFSADFRDHPVTERILPVLSRIDRAKFRVTAFSFGLLPPDAMTEKVRSACDAYEDVRFVDDASIAELARKRGVDIAIDLMGHTERARTGIFVQRAAPLQVQWLGYPGTMGTSAMDGLLADSIVVPETERVHYTERVIAMPVTYQPNGRPEPLPPPERSALGLPRDAVVLAAFNDRLKIAPEAFRTWMRILAQCPDTVLWLVDGGERAADNLRAEARTAGVAPERLLFAKRVSLEEHRARLPAADLALDTVPYGGHATTSDLLAAGVPVITVLGNTFAGRVAASLLHAAGLPELVTTSLADYEALVASLAKGPRRLAELRKKVEAARETAALFDADRFTHDFECACAALVA